MARTTGPRVDFAQAVRAIRPPREDELSVMRHFSNHAVRCPKCADAYQTWKEGGELCDKGHSLARDVAMYIYSKGAKPFSIIDRDNGERIEIEVPVTYQPVRQLVKAIDRGLSLSKRRKPIISQDANYYVAPRPKPATYYDRESNANVIEVIPGSNRHDRKERERYPKDADRPRQKVYVDSKGSLYRRDEEARQARSKRYEEQPIVIQVEPRRTKYRL